jgi:hypothetical protein
LQHKAIDRRWFDRDTKSNGLEITQCFASATSKFDFDGGVAQGIRATEVHLDPTVCKTWIKGAKFDLAGITAGRREPTQDASQLREGLVAPVDFRPARKMSVRAAKG